jgi:Asp-tRNA(Asn)/Glu-tRNA(Gln) amidotransferase B subunit
VQVSDEAEIASIIDQVIQNNPDPLKKYLNGKQGLFGFFVGQIMQASQGKANPKVIQKLLRQKLDEAEGKQ